MKREHVLALRGMAFAVCTMADELLERMPEEAPADVPADDESPPEGDDASTPDADPEADPEPVADPENELLVGALAGLDTDDRKELAEYLELTPQATFAWSKKGHVPEYRRAQVKEWFKSRDQDLEGEDA